MSELIELVWNDLQTQIDELRADLTQLQNTTEQAGYSDGVPAYNFADLPTDGLADGIGFITIAWCTNCLKSGESSGNGTGILLCYNPSTATWQRIGDYVNASI